MSNEDERGVLDLSDPKAREMQERISAAKQGNIPVGGVPMPKMPRLDQPPPGAPRDRGMGVQQAHQQQAQTQAGGSHTAMSADQHNKAIASGQAIGGVGSAYVANQPKGFQAPSAEAAAQQMEIKGDADNPANPARPEGGLRQETLDQINAVAEAQDTPEAPPEEGKEEEKPAEKDLYDEFDYGALGSAARNLLTDKERREVIEARCEEMDFEDLILNQELRQDVPIKKGFVPMFRTVSGAEDLFCKRMIGDEEGSDRYIMDKFAALSLACGIFALNGTPLPDHLDKDGLVDDELFKKKLAALLKYPIIIVADLSVNYTWFTFRVQKMLALDQVKDF